MGACDYEAVSALVDGELSEDECEAVIQHLNECRQCCHLFERFHATRGLVRGEEHAAVPTDLSDRIADAIAAESGETAGTAAGDNVVPGPGAGRQVAAGRPRGGWAWVATAAGVAGLAVVAGAMWLQTGTGPGNAGSSPSLAGSTSQSETAASSPKTPAPASASENKNSVAAIQRYLPEHSSFVPSGPEAEFQRTRLEVKDP